MESPNDDGYWEYKLKEKYWKNWKQYHKTFTMEKLEELYNSKEYREWLMTDPMGTDFIEFLKEQK